MEVRQPGTFLGHAYVRQLPSAAWLPFSDRGRKAFLSALSPYIQRGAEMTKPMVKRDAGLFAQGFTKGRESKVHHLEQDAAKKAARMAYLEKRIGTLARWRKLAIDRWSVGPLVVKELDREARRF